MSGHLYFAYGSNMLTARLQRRCPGARVIGPGFVTAMEIAFSKTGTDGSGKATLAHPDDNQGLLTSIVHGVVYDIADDEWPDLDFFEGLGKGYDRLDDFPVTLAGNSKMTSTRTYIAGSGFVSDTLLPYDWYHALVLAGAREHNLPEDYIEKLAQFSARPDPEAARPTHREALEILNAIA